LSSCLPVCRDAKFCVSTTPYTDANFARFGSNPSNPDCSENNVPAMPNASGPEIRIIAVAPRPAGVAMAQMVFMYLFVCIAPNCAPLHSACMGLIALRTFCLSEAAQGILSSHLLIFSSSHLIPSSYHRVIAKKYPLFPHAQPRFRRRCNPPR